MGDCYVNKYINFNKLNVYLWNGFLYSWHCFFRDVRKGAEPFVKCHYTSPGNYTFQLSIEANTPQHSRMTGLYSVDLTVLGGCRIIISLNWLFIVPVVLTCQRFFCFVDAIKSVELRGPLFITSTRAAIYLFIWRKVNAFQESKTNYLGLGRSIIFII